MESMDPSFPNGIEIFHFKPCDFSKNSGKNGEIRDNIFSQSKGGNCGKHDKEC